MKKPLIGINMDVCADEQRYRINAGYVDCVVAAGGMPLLAPCTSDLSLLREYVKMCDGFLFTGGKDYPSSLYGQKPHRKLDVQDKQRINADLELAKLVIAGKMPILGICAGLQLIQIVSGGKLIQHLRRAKNHLGDNYHSISIISGRLLMKMYGLGRITVNSSHHQAADPAGIPSSLEVAAIAGDGTVEALEGKGARFLLAVQWHPERMIASREYGNTMKLFRAFVGAARACA